MVRLRLLWYVLRLGKWDTRYLLIDARRYARTAQAFRLFGDSPVFVTTFFGNAQQQGESEPYADFDDALEAILDKMAGSNFHSAELAPLDYRIDAANRIITVPMAGDGYYEIRARPGA